MIMGVADGIGHLVNGEIEAGEIARIGGALKAAIDRIGAGIHGGAQTGGGSGRAHQLRLE